MKITTITKTTTSNSRKHFNHHHHQQQKQKKKKKDDDDNDSDDNDNDNEEEEDSTTKTTFFTNIAANPNPNGTMFSSRLSRFFQWFSSFSSPFSSSIITTTTTTQTKTTLSAMIISKRRLIIEWKPLTNFQSIFMILSICLFLCFTGIIWIHSQTIHQYQQHDTTTTELLLQSFGILPFLQQQPPPEQQRIPIKNITKIIGFSDSNYKQIAEQWYDELTKLGYHTHVVGAWDLETSNYLKFQNIRHELVFPFHRNLNINTNQQEEQGAIHKINNNSIPFLSTTTFTTTTPFDPDPPSTIRDYCFEEIQSFSSNEKRRQQLYRRMLFASRWKYVLEQLQNGYHVLLTDVDNVFTQYKSMTEMEDSNYDVFHAYAGTVPSFPLNLYRLMGLTVCGGMSWFRSTSSVIRFVQDIATSCGCIPQQDTNDNNNNQHDNNNPSTTTSFTSTTTSNNKTTLCSCFCDDQVVLNKYIYYEYIWDGIPPNASSPNGTVPSTIEEMKWTGYTGYCRKTGHRIKIWDRDVAYRDVYNSNPSSCPNRTTNWIAMPTKLPRGDTWKIWKETCPR